MITRKKAYKFCGSRATPRLRSQKFMAWEFLQLETSQRELIRDGDDFRTIRSIKAGNEVFKFW